MQDLDIVLNELRIEKRSKDMLTEKYNTTLAWIHKINKGISFHSMIEKCGLRDVIIYGLDELGMRVIEVCMQEFVRIVAISDKNIREGGYKFKGIPMVSIKDLEKYQHEETGIIVAAVGYFEEIESNLSNIGLRNILSLRQLIEGKQ